MAVDRHSDRRLGMDRPITRRDVLQGAMAGTVSGVLGGVVGESGARADDLHAVSQDQPGYYPPRLTGLRGSHAGSFEVAHARRDGQFREAAAAPPAPDDSYDLCVVGGGISGLSAAYFYRERNPNARILILDNHDDFGGHAKRNEFMLGGRLSLMNGGTMGIDSPTPYSAVADGLLRALGVDPPALRKQSSDRDFYAARGMAGGIFFDRETFGADKLCTGTGSRPMAAVLADAPLSDRSKRDVARIHAGEGAAMPGLSDAAIKDRLSRMSYADFLRDVLGADPDALKVMQQVTHGEWGVGIDAVPALDAWGFGYPGFDGLALKPGRAPRMGYTGGGYVGGGSYRFHFPDGNASIARLLVRSLVPEAIPGSSATDIVTAPTDYAQLDKRTNRVRLRLSSTVVLVRNQATFQAIGSQPAGVEIVYSRFAKLSQVRARHCVLACWNGVVPYICPELPAAQKEALRYQVKTPLLYVSVALRSWRAFATLGLSSVYYPAMYYANAALNSATNIGGYRSVAGVDKPVLLHMVRTPCAPGLSQREQNRAGRAEMQVARFEEFERHIRDQLARTLAPGGFDPASDITAITVNRWPHGYAYEYNSLFDPDWPAGQAPHEIGRKRCGRIAIANSDSGAGAYSDVAIDQAHRAVTELADG
jgi:spermidine dehydrogenase